MQKLHIFQAAGYSEGKRIFEEKIVFGKIQFEVPTILLQGKQIYSFRNIFELLG